MNGVTWGRVTEQHDKIIIVCSGPSLTNFDFKTIKGIGHIICVNNAYKSVPFGDYWFTLDPWGLGGEQIPKPFSGKLYAAVPDNFGLLDAKVIQHRVNAPKNIIYLHRLISHNKPSISSETAYVTGLSEDNGCINTGNSGFGALGLAYHMKPKKILILGMDGDIGYYYSKTERNRPLKYLPLLMESTVTQLDKAGISVLNGSINSNITCFPRYSLLEAVAKFRDE